MQGAEDCPRNKWADPTEIGKKIGKHRNVITKIETEGGNITLKILFDIIEGGLGGKVEIKIIF